MKRNLSLLVVLAIVLLLVASVADAGRFGGSSGGFHSSPSPRMSSPAPTFHAPAPASPAPTAFHAPAAAPASSTLPNRYGSTTAATPSPVKAPVRSAADTQMNRKANMTGTKSSNMSSLQRPAAAPANYNYQSSMSVRRPISTGNYYFSTAPQYRPSYVPTFILVGGYHRDLFYDPYYHNYGYYDNGGFYPYGGPSVGVTPNGNLVVVHHSNTGLIILLVLLALAVVVGLAVASSRRGG